MAFEEEGARFTAASDVAPGIDLGRPAGVSFVGDPDACSWGPGRMDVVAVGDDGRLWHDPGEGVDFEGNGWAGWESHSAPVALRGNPSCASRVPGHLEIYAIGRDNHLYVIDYSSGSGWGGWSQVDTGGVQGDLQGIDAWSPNFDTVFVGLTTSTHAYRRRWTWTWLAWQSLPIADQVGDFTPVGGNFFNSRNDEIRWYSFEGGGAHPAVPEPAPNGGAGLDAARDVFGRTHIAYRKYGGGVAVYTDSAPRLRNDDRVHDIHIAPAAGGPAITIYRRNAHDTVGTEAVFVVSSRSGTIYYAPHAVTMTYDDVLATGAHNAYYFDWPQNIVGNPWRLRALELDFHINRGSGLGCPAGRWAVHHVPTESGVYGYDNCASTEALAALLAWHKSNPLHDVVTLNIELNHSAIKDDILDENDGHGVHEPYDAHDFDEFDAAVRALPLFEPRDFLAQCPGARGHMKGLVAAIKNGTCSWPTLDELRGKFIVVIHKGTGAYFLDQDTPGSARAAFQMEVDTADFITALWVDTYDVDLKNRARSQHLNVWFTADDRCSLCDTYADAGGISYRNEWNAGLGSPQPNVMRSNRSAWQAAWGRTENAGGFKFCPHGSSSCADDLPGMTEDRAPPGDTCSNALTIPGKAGTWTLTGSTATAADDVGGPCGGAGGGDMIYSLTLARNSRVTIETAGSAIDTVLSLYSGNSACPGTLKTCNDDDGSLPNGASRLEDVHLAAGTYYVVVDSHGAAGNYRLNVRVIPVPDDSRVSAPVWQPDRR